MRDTRDMFMAPKMGLINEDHNEEYEGTFKAYGGGKGVQLPTQVRRYDSFLDGTDLALD